MFGAFRQEQNNKEVFEAIMKKNKKDIEKLINNKELKRVLNETNMDSDTLYEYCFNNEVAAKILSGRISKNSSRQGSKDESTQIELCSKAGVNVGINIDNLGPTDFIPTKNGKIITNKDKKSLKIRKDECLKSFDAKISGVMNGWLFAKVCFDSGGNQDNVFGEADRMCEWVKEYGSKYNENLFVILIDTNLFKEYNNLKKKYEDISSLLITDHYEFQNYLLNFKLN
tara:strand:- start:1890 stop:2570 length:681 start_codon:yes stop_codon:yes gene_type:complete